AKAFATDGYSMPSGCVGSGADVERGAAVAVNGIDVFVESETGPSVGPGVGVEILLQAERTETSRKQINSILICSKLVVDVSNFTLHALFNTVSKKSERYCRPRLCCSDGDLAYSAIAKSRQEVFRSLNT